MKYNTYLDKLEFIFKKVKESGTKDSTEQFIYTVEEIGEIAEVLRCLNKDVRKKNLTKEDLASEIGDTLITLYLITKFEDLDFFDILDKAIKKEYNRWKLEKTEQKEDLKDEPINPEGLEIALENGIAEYIKKEVKPKKDFKRELCNKCNGKMVFHRLFRDNDEDLIYEFICGKCGNKDLTQFPQIFDPEKYPEGLVHIIDSEEHDNMEILDWYRLIWNTAQKELIKTFIKKLDGAIKYYRPNPKYLMKIRKEYKR